MKTKKKQKPGLDIPLLRKSKEGEQAERGRARKREALNKARNSESLESIKEYVFSDGSYSDALIRTGLIDRYEDYYNPDDPTYRKY
jgi:hypothetical protein